jgi:hypothetical protein
MEKYLLKGTQYVGGSDFFSSGRQFKPAEIEFFANDDSHARERAKQLSHISSPTLFKEISLVDNPKKEGCLCKQEEGLRSTHCPLHGTCNCCHGCTCPTHDEPEQFVPVPLNFDW